MKTSFARPHELGPREVAQWRAWQSAKTELQTPFLTPGFACAVGAVSPDAYVAVVEEGRDIVGFLPFELRSRGVATAIGRKLNTRQGFVHRPGLEWSWAGLLDSIGLDVLELPDLVSFQAEGNRSMDFASVPIVDASARWSNYLSGISKHKAVKTILYKERKLRRDQPDVSFATGSAKDVLNLPWLIAWKSRQYRRSGWPDPFARREIVELLHRLAEEPGEGLSSVASSLCVRGKLVATDMSLTTDTVFAGWFSAHDTEYGRYSPGAIRTLRTIEAAFDLGVRSIDLCRGDEAYKQILKTGDSYVATGFISRPSARSLAYQAGHVPASAIMSYVLARPEIRSLVRESLKKVGSTRERLAGAGRSAAL